MQPVTRPQQSAVSSTSLLAIIAAQIRIIVPMVGRSYGAPAELHPATIPPVPDAAPVLGPRDLDLDDPWSRIKGLTLVIMKGVATVTGTTTSPAARIEVVEKVGAAKGVMEVRDRIKVLARWPIEDPR